MARLGKYYWPTYDLGKAVEWVKELITKRVDITDEAKIAGVLGHKAPRGGTFESKMTVLSRYGLIERKKRITDLAQRIVHLTGKEKFKAAQEAFYNIPLFKELDDRKAYRMNLEEFGKTLVAITGAPLGIAATKAKDIYEVYKESRSYVESLRPEEEGMRTLEKKEAPTPTSRPMTLKIIAEAIGLEQTFPLTTRTVEILKGLVPDAVLEEIKRRVEAMEAKTTEKSIG